MDFKVIIPARLASTRLPNKPLLDIAGKPMVIWVIEKAIASGAKEVVVATDHAEIAKVVQSAGFNAILTSPNHPTGTDRLAEAVSLLGWQAEETVVNVQGDEPLIDPALIKSVAQNLQQHESASIATLCHPITDSAQVFDSNVVKLVMDKQGYALYFSRAPIPYARDAYSKHLAMPAGMNVYRHIGIYAYKVAFLHDYQQLAMAEIEQYESLEQLRALWHGYKISVAVTAHAPATGVDTKEDLMLVRHILAINNIN